MKTQKISFLMGLLAVTSCAFFSCDDSESWPKVDGAAPALQLTAGHYQGAVGRTIPIKGTITDNDGIATIDLVCPELYIRKTIDIIDIYGEPLKSYDLNYSFPVAADETGDNFNIEVTVTDVCGQQTKQTMLVTMDGDFVAPTFDAAPGSLVTLIMKARTSYTLNVSATDDQNLEKLTVDIEGVYNEVFPMSGKTGKYSKKIEFPNVEGDYAMKLTLTDKTGKESVKTSTITITSDVPDYPNLWIADVATADELNSDIFGVPSYVGHKYDGTGEGAKPIPYTYEARYYNQKSGTKVWFLGQKSDFSPICYGVDAEGLLNDDEEAMQAITLDQAGVYYKITINIKTYEIESETYAVSDALAAFRTELYDQPETFLVWDQWYINFQLGYLSGGPADVIPFAQDKNNPNLFYLEEPLTFDAEHNLKANDDGTYTTNFMIHNFHPGGWWDVVCYKPNSKDNPEYWPWWGNNSQEQLNTPNWTEWPNQPKGPNDWCKVVVPESKFGNYRLWFDAHTEQAKLVPVK